MKEPDSQRGGSMIADDYGQFFERTTGYPPYPYQNALGTTHDFPALLAAPTGAGKTAAVIVAWLWKRLHEQASTPRRLVYCLPTRVLVEQTVDCARRWVAKAGMDIPVSCLLYTSDAADDLLCVDLGGRRIIKKKKKKNNTR